MSVENRGGVFVVRYDSPEALSPERQAELESALRAASREQPVGVVFVVGPAVKLVDHRVPEYWLGVTMGGAARLAAMAVVAPNPAVSVATRGFSTANILRDTAVAVRPFSDEREALEWVAAEVARARAPRA